MTRKPYEMTYRRGDDVEFIDADTLAELQSKCSGVSAPFFASATVNGMPIDEWRDLGCPAQDDLSAPTVTRRREQLRSVYTNPATFARGES